MINDKNSLIYLFNQFQQLREKISGNKEGLEFKQKGPGIIS
jgi:hypothetical protein